MAIRGIVLPTYRDRIAPGLEARRAEEARERADSGVEEGGLAARRGTRS